LAFYSFGHDAYNNDERVKLLLLPPPLLVIVIWSSPSSLLLIAKTRTSGAWFYFHVGCELWFL